MSGAVQAHGVGFESAGGARPAPTSCSSHEGAGSDRQRQAMRTAIRAVCPKLELAFRLLDQDRVRSCIALAQAFTLGNVLDHRHYVLAERTVLLGDVHLAEYQNACMVRGVHVSSLGPLGRAWESGSVQVAQDVSGLTVDVHPLCTLRATRCWDASIAGVVYIPVHDADPSAWRRAGGGDGPACGVLAVIELFLRPGGDGTALPAAISATHHALDAAGLSMSPVEEDQVVAIDAVADPRPRDARSVEPNGTHHATHRAQAPQEQVGRVRVHAPATPVAPFAPLPPLVAPTSPSSASTSVSVSVSVSTAADSTGSSPADSTDANGASSAAPGRRASPAPAPAPSLPPLASPSASSSSSSLPLAVPDRRACRGARSVRFENEHGARDADRDAASGSPHTPSSAGGAARLEFLEFRSGAAVDALGAAPCERELAHASLHARSRSEGTKLSPPVSPESPQLFDRFAADGPASPRAARRPGGLVRTRSAHALRVNLDG